MYALIKSQEKREDGYPERLEFKFVTGAEIYDDHGEVGLKIKLANGDDVDGKIISGFFDDANAAKALNDAIGVELVDWEDAESRSDIEAIKKLLGGMGDDLLN